MNYDTFLHKIHGAIAVTAITPLLNLNLNYEKLHSKYTHSFKENNYLKRFFILFLFILGKNQPQKTNLPGKTARTRRKITLPQVLSQEDSTQLFEL